MQLQQSRCAGGLRAGGARLPSRAGRRAVQPHATAKQSQGDVRAARMARILRQYEAAGAPAAVAAVAEPPARAFSCAGPPASCSWMCHVCLQHGPQLQPIWHACACPPRLPGCVEPPTCNAAHRRRVHTSPPPVTHSPDVDKQQEELQAYVGERDERRGDPEEEGSTRVLRASAGYRATDERDQARMDIYLPLQADGCAAVRPRLGTWLCSGDAGLGRGAWYTWRHGGLRHAALHQRAPGEGAALHDI